ncbi:MAG: hypothetical protein SFV15_17695 [Polyangiaceae bacterium]|nr:hypothetical protein [Polyangiaceae bacterium]
MTARKQHSYGKGLIAGIGVGLLFVACIAAWWIWYRLITDCWGSDDERLLRSLQTIRSQAQGWYLRHERSCPSVDIVMKDLGNEPHCASAEDPWGTPIRLTCHDGITTSSAGPDKQWETRDDVVFPKWR